tara:strand:+ start:171 stop:398 length:228 start_codon:yes stop_codon:yes gene_type:complete
MGEIMLDPNKHGVFNKEGYMNDSKLTRVVWLSMLGINTLVWYSIFTNGFFITLFWLVIISVIIAVIFKIMDKEIK